LLYSLEAIPHFPPQNEPSDEVKLASQIVRVADRACSILGIETGNVPLPVDRELGEILNGNPNEELKGDLFSA
jgi:hypothetical protein